MGLSHTNTIRVLVFTLGLDYQMLTDIQ